MSELCKQCGLPYDEPGYPSCAMLHKNPLAPAQGSADAIIRNLLQSSDCSWYERNEGHDWREAVDAAEKYLKGCPPNSEIRRGEPDVSNKSAGDPPSPASNG